MLRMNNSGKLHLTKKAFIILVGSVLLVALVGWILLISGLLKKDRKPDGTAKPKESKYVIPEVPSGYAMVFRLTSCYDVSDKGEKILRSEYEYDEKGRRVSYVDYDAGGNFREQTIYVYDGNGNMIKETVYDASGLVNKEIETVYNENGGIKERREDFLKEIYNDNGNTLYRIVCMEDGSEFVWDEYYYSSEGLLTEHIMHDSGAEGRDLYYYDSLGTPIKTEYYSDGTLVREDIYVTPTLMEKYEYTGESEQYLKEKQEFDEKGRIVHRYTYAADGSVNIDQADEWDEDGNNTKILRYKNGEFVIWCEYEYADKDAIFRNHLRPTKTTWKTEEGVVESYDEHEYLPEFGNVREQYFNADGTRREMKGSDGLWGYVCKKDSYGNPICRVKCLGDKEVVIEEFQFTPMIIPVDCMNDYDRKLAEK